MIRRNKSRDFIIVEKGSQVGGTWNDNRYPGCCSDVWSHLYSYSFDSNPSWTREYPGQEEIHAYLVGVAERWGLFKHIRFNTAVDEASWDDVAMKWKVKVNICGKKEAEFSKSYTINSSYLVSGVGQLNLPYYPKLPGLDDYKGKVMHSARWDWSFPTKGKRIAIIGNGATSAQIIPEVAKVCDSLTVFQRTPNWIVPRGDAPISDAMRSIYKYVPLVRKRYRAQLMDKREKFFDAAVVDDEESNEALAKGTLEMMKRQLPDKPEYWDKLVPDYPPGCKRVILSDDYFPALNLPHVKLETRPLQTITANGIKVDGEDYDYDLIILATGFQTMEFMYPIKIYGTNGRSIEDIWKCGARAHLGMTVESLPNFAMLYGPNTNLGHNSLILMIEAQSRYINTMIGRVLKTRSRGASIRILPKVSRIEEYNKYIQERISTLTFASSKCNSWYKNDDGLVTNNWCGTVIEYQKAISEIDWNDFDVFCSDPSLVSSQSKEYIGRIVEETTFSVFGLAMAVASAAVVFKFAAGTPAVSNALSKIRA
ncbi:FAD-binding monooxygenase [Lachnellula occidentalis]|uniref:FAD-binding monooxygenase n=1 Tax=Lachnellula occidentalis TaxID=215460 RepID=A0A8H8S6S7_9HELO|nr:FAD-binding monooxygenase [Lachnellula occidentalis]